MYPKSLLALAATIAAADAAIKGFNYGSTNTDGSAVTLERFTQLFNTAKNLPGANGFTSARLYTTVQAGTANSPISAIQAAIDTKTTLLLGLWTSAGQENFNNELAALRSAISTYGTSFTSLIEGISVGSEDLYRYGATGVKNQAGVGVGPDVIVNYIGQVRALIAGTAASNAKITHVDTFNSYTNASNSAVIDAIDFVSMDAYPYFQPEDNNVIGNSNATFYDSLDATIAVSKGKPVWVTETGWPIAGPTIGLAVASAANSEFYWKNTGCSLFRQNVNTYWYTLQDTYPIAPETNFGIIGRDLTAAPLHDLTCPAAAVVSSSSTSAVASSTAAVVPVPVPSSSSAPVLVASSSAPVVVASSSAAVVASSSAPVVASSSAPVVASSSVPVPSSSSAPVVASSSAPVVAASSSAPVVASSAAPVAASSSAPVASSAASSRASSVASVLVAGSAASESDVTVTVRRTTISTISNCAAQTGVTVTVQSTAYVTVSCPAGQCSSTAVVPPVVASSAASSAPASSSVVTRASSSAASSALVSSSLVTRASSSVPASSSAVVPPVVASSAASSAPASSSVVTRASSSAASSAPASSTSASASASASACPPNLNGEYQYPHLIIPVNSSSPNTAYGTQYFPVLSPSVSTIFNFDIPASYAGKMCTLVMLFPEKKDLETTDYTYSKTGGISFDELKAPATEATTYANAPASGIHVGAVDNLTPGNSYVVTSHECGAGERIAFRASSVGGLDLTWFNDWNPSPLGVFIRVC